MRTTAYTLVREDSATCSTYKLPLEVEFPKRSIDESPCLSIQAIKIRASWLKSAKELNAGDKIDIRFVDGKRKAEIL